MFYGNEANKGPYLTDPFWPNGVHVVLRKVSSINTGSFSFWTIQSVSAKIPIHHPTKLKLKCKSVFGRPLTLREKDYLNDVSLI